MGSSPNNHAAKRFLEMGDAELINVLTRERSEYTEQALTLAEEILAGRGITLDDVRQCLEDDARTVAAEKREHAAMVAVFQAQLDTAARKSGACLVCSGQPVHAERTIETVGRGIPSAAISPEEIATELAERMKHTATPAAMRDLTLSVVIPFCRACDTRHPAKAAPRAIFGVAAGVIGVGAAIMLLVAIGEAANWLQDDWFRQIGGALVLFCSFLGLALPTLLHRHRLRRMAHYHPMAKLLRANGFEFRGHAPSTDPPPAA